MVPVNGLGSGVGTGDGTAGIITIWMSTATMRSPIFAAGLPTISPHSAPISAAVASLNGATVQRFCLRRRHSSVDLHNAALDLSLRVRIDLDLHALQRYADLSLKIHVHPGNLHIPRGRHCQVARGLDNDVLLRLDRDRGRLRVYRDRIAFAVFDRDAAARF